MAKVKINPSAKKKIAKSAMDICKEYAKEVEEDMSDFFQEQIDEFYNDPAYKDRPPRVYRRHHERKAYPNEPRGLDKTYEKVFKEKERSFEGGIRISTDDMYNTGYHGSTEQVLESSALANGIGKALITTQAGLAAAIPGSLAMAHLRHRLKKHHA